MLIYTRRAAPKAPKRRSRAGCVHCKEKKKKCSEERPSCQRCIERGLDCHYEPIQPRRRRRTASPADPSRIAGQPISTGSSPSTSFKSRVESLRQDSNSGAPALHLSVSSPSLDSEASWDMPSSYDETASQYHSDFRSDASVSPDIMAAFPRNSVRHSSVPVESMDMFISDYDRRRSLLSTPELMSEQFRRASNAGTPDMMSVPYRRTSDSGVAEVFGAIPYNPSLHVEPPDVVTSAPVPSNSNFHQAANNFIPHPDQSFHHPSSNSTSGEALNSTAAMQQHMTPAGFMTSLPATTGDFYQGANAFVDPTTTNVNTLVSDAFYPSADAFVGPQTTQAQLQTMGNWATMDQMNQNYYMAQRR